MTELTLQEYQFRDMKLTWLRGVDKMTDAGTLFGPVQKLFGHAIIQQLKKI